MSGGGEGPRGVRTATGVRAVGVERCKRSTFCCGAGGSHMWLEESQGQRINDHRMEEAVGTGADVIAVETASRPRALPSPSCCFNSRGPRCA